MPKIKTKKPAEITKTVKDETVCVENPERKIEYAEHDAEICMGAGAITVAQAKTLMGWEEIPEGAGTDTKPFLTDMHKKRVRCTNNDRNRPFDMETSLTYAQDILNRRWAPDGPNGETIIIGRTALVLSGQHRLVGLILAGQIWEGAQFNGADQSVHWQSKWTTEPTIESYVALGVVESKETLRTLDNVRPRTDADVMYTEDYYRDHTSSDRKAMSRLVSHAVRLLWDRTGAKTDPFSPRKSVGESLAFIDRHPKILQCVEHIWQENQKGGVNRYMSPGYAAAMLYLMAACHSDSDDYYNGEPPNEELLDMDVALDLGESDGEGKSLTTSTWERACEFWTLLATNNRSMNAVTKHRIPIEGDKKGEVPGLYCFPQEGSLKGSLEERIGILCKAWRQFVAGHSPTQAGIRLKYTLDWNGDGTLSSAVVEERPSAGGIDLANPRSQQGYEDPKTTVVDSNSVDDGDEPPTPDEIQERADTELRRRATELNDRIRAEKQAKQAKRARVLQEGITEAGKRAAAANGGGEKPAKPKKPTSLQAKRTAEAVEADAKLAAEKGADSADATAPASAESDSSTSAG